MENNEKQNHETALSEGGKGSKICMKVADSNVTLNFPNKAHDSVITEVKRMLLVGHTRKDVQQ